MLQQTQVSRVLQKYPQFLRRFPSFSSLARARTSSVIRAWKGMGYNNRAIRLQQLARIVNTKYRGRLPESVEELQSLPGVGKYTAHALACIVFKQQVPVVDTNVKRVLERLFPVESKRLGPWQLAELVLPGSNAHLWNQALMDLGATICNSSNPTCDVCPVVKFCPSSFRVRRRNVIIKKREPSHDGLPNRIYRGRIVDALRHARQNSFVSLKRLGLQIKDSYSTHDEKWLVGLLKNLEKDGLLVLHNTKSGPAASLPL